MSLNNFFRINLPYGISKNKMGEWFAFNREYVPLGWNSTKNAESIHNDFPYSGLPISTSFKGLTDAKILKLITETAAIQRDEFGNIKTVFFYNDSTNPTIDPKCWGRYLTIIKALSVIKTADGKDYF